MKRLLFTILALLTMALAFAQAKTDDIKIVFSNADISQVLRAISVRTGANIVYSGKDKLRVTLNVTVHTVEEAVRSAAAAAGLTYRKVGDLFVVATNDSMRSVLAPYSETAFVILPEGLAAKIQAVLTEAFPHATIKAVGNRLSLKGLAFDLAEARMMIDELAAAEEAKRPITDTVQLISGNPNDIAKAVSTVFSDVAATPTGESTKGGSIILVGPAPQVAAAKALATKLDVPPAGEGDKRIVFKIKEMRYANAMMLRDFLAKAVPEVESIVGPANYVPPRPRFSPLSNSITGQGSGSGGGGGGLGGAQGAGTGAAAGAGGAELSVGSSSTQVSTGSVKSKTLVLKGPAAAVEEAFRLAESLDVKPQQVSVEVQVVETTKTFSENIGLKFGWTPFQFFEKPVGTSVGPDGLTVPTTTNAAGVGQFSRAPLNFNATINALIDKGNAKILASPNVQVIDNEEANVFIGSTIRARIAQATSLGGQTVDIREFPIGIVLLIHPRVNGDSHITMHVNPVVSTVTSVTTDNIPQTSSREAETSVVVKDGETIVIGGLIRDEYSKLITEVPILSKIPILGELFKNRNTKKERTEVLVTITPRIIRDTPAVGK